MTHDRKQSSGLITLFLIAFAGLTGQLQAQSVECAMAGTWESEDKSRTVEFYESGGRWFGKLVSSSNEDAKPGSILFKELEYDEQKRKYKGKMVRPGSDKEISAEVSCVSPAILQSTGRMGIMSRSIKWHKTKEPRADETGSTTRAEPKQSEAQNTVGDQNQQSPTSSVQAGRYAFPSAGERFQTFTKRSFSPRAFLRPGFNAAMDQNRDEPSEWGQGAEGYAKRYASWFGQNLISEASRYGLSEALKVDVRYQKCDCTGFFPRVGHAVKETFIARTTSGREVVSIPTLVSPYGAAMVSIYGWYPGSRDWKDGLQFGTMNLATQSVFNVFREFFLKR